MGKYEERAKGTALARASSFSVSMSRLTYGGDATVARPEPNEVLRFGRTVTTLLADAIRIPCTLRLVIDPDVFGGCSLPPYCLRKP